MSLRLYLLDGCPFGHRALFAMREKGLAFDTSYFARGARPPELEALGPRAKSPTLFDGDARVFDSQVVLEYLEDRFPEPPLLPETPLARAEVRMFQARVVEELAPKFGAVITEAYFKPERDETRVREKSRAFEQALEPWDPLFRGREFANGDRLSLADITLYTLFPAARAAAGTEIPEHLSNLRAWHDRMARRPTSARPRAA